MPLCSARSRHEILCLVSVDASLATIPNNAGTPLCAAIGSEVCPSSMAAPHELFDHAGILMTDTLSMFPEP